MQSKRGVLFDEYSKLQVENGQHGLSQVNRYSVTLHLALI